MVSTSCANPAVTLAPACCHLLGIRLVGVAVFIAAQCIGAHLATL